MKNTINIQGSNQSFPYILEYSRLNTVISKNSAKMHNDNIVCLYKDSVRYHKGVNEWTKVSTDGWTNDCVPDTINLSNIKVLIPDHSISTYSNGVKYAITMCTWINGVKIDLGSTIFSLTDTYAYIDGPLKKGNNEYHTCFDIEIIDPFEIIYSDNWSDFRNKICNEPLGTNYTVSPLYVSLYAVDKYNDKFLMMDEYVGGCTCFNIANDRDVILDFGIDISIDPLGIALNTTTNDVYDSIYEYINETYLIDVLPEEILLDIVVKSKDSIIMGPHVQWNSEGDKGKFVQILKWNDISDSDAFKIFFNDWNTFEEGWNIVGSLNVIRDEEEIISIISNEIPITQEVFSIFTNNGAEKIIDISDMNVTNYTLINKIENNIVQIERPNESKSNILQPVFFRANEAELITLHPAVTENISINLDDYKSKVEEFTLQIDGFKFKSIGQNRFGVLFKMTANTLPATSNGGIYYILNENMELVTTGKYTCVR